MDMADRAAVLDPAVLRVPNYTRDLNPPRLARGGAGDRSCFHSLGHVQRFLTDETLFSMLPL
jgi:hypothetical protein